MLGTLDYAYRQVREAHGEGCAAALKLSLGAGMCVDMCVDICVGMCAGMCVGMCVGMG